MDENCKTIFVLDHTPYFGISSEEVSLDLRGTRVSVKKSLWTNAIESSIEYCRIVWDLFPNGKLIRFIISDRAAHIVNTWEPGTQSMNHIRYVYNFQFSLCKNNINDFIFYSNAMIMVGPPRNLSQTSDYTVIHGLRAAIEALAESTDFQKDFMQKNDRRVSNRGRVIVCTSARDNSSMNSLEKIFHQVLIQQNVISSKSEHLLNIDFCHLVIINLYPSTESLVTSRGYHEISPILGSEIHSYSSAKLSKLLMSLILKHYNLASTTVTNIPMKEEQNSSSSANYDVEIFHESLSHSVFLGAELPRSIKEGFEYETVVSFLKKKLDIKIKQNYNSFLFHMI